jgi:acyl-CoA synthetase (AMP-forming)/AMP-acid ligase II/phosphatidylglycerophosphate synthase
LHESANMHLRKSVTSERVIGPSHGAIDRGRPPSPLLHLKPDCDGRSGPGNDAHMEKRHWVTIVFANSLTLGRLIAGLAFPWISVAWRPELVLAAAASDVVDGAISRKFCGASPAGQLLDPIADKTFLLMVVGTLWMEGSLALWQIALLGMREWVVLSIGIGLVVARNWSGLLRMAPRWPGKVATGAQLVFLASLLFLQKDLPGLFQITVALSGLAAADYLWRAGTIVWAPRAARCKPRSVKNEGLSLTRILLRNCRRNLWRTKFADSTGQRLTGGSLLSRSLALAQCLRRNVIATDEDMVGILLPPSVAAVLANAALSLDCRIAVNLNYTLPPGSIDACIAQCRIRTVLTSRRVIERMKLRLSANIVCLEDLVDKVTWQDKVRAAVETYLFPTPLLERMLEFDRTGLDDLMTVCFTSGSTGEPKGVMLSHRNVASNLDAVCQLLELRPDDVALGLMPFFHAYGLTFGLWAGLTLDPLVVLQHNPLDGREVGALCRNYGVTIMMATPTFLRIYLRRCEPQQLASLEVVAAGAEKLSPELAKRFEEKFGVRVIEAYGTTELSPLAAINLLARRRTDGQAVDAKAGTVGRTLPGVCARVVDLETGAELGPDQPGMLLIKGPNVMKGYLGKPDLTAQVIRDSWYETGDIAHIDADGFIAIIDRKSRFSKIGGEMVPHREIEEALARILGTEEEIRAVVIALPDKKKGERLIVMHEPISKTPEQICKQLASCGMTNLWIPSQDSFIEVDQLPLLGTGKPDLRQLKALAMAKLGQSSSLRS